jgi:hypothetical protein
MEGASTTGYHYKSVDLYFSVTDFYIESLASDCYMSGKLDPTGIAYMPCFLNGSYLSLNNNINCFVNGFGENNNINCFIKGFFTNTEYPLVGGSGIQAYMPVYIYGTGIDSTGVPAGTTYNTSGTFNLFTYGATPSISNNFNMYTKGAGGEYEYFNMFIKGVSGLIESSFDLFAKGYVYNTSGLNLFIRGF